MNHEPTHLDLFSGIAGFALAAGWAGFRTIAFSEIDPYATAVLKKHWPDVPNLGDIRRSSTWPNLGNVSLLTGGFPCQPFSCAGKQRGKDDDRHLWPAMRDVIKRVRPAWVCGENVPGIIGMELNQVLIDLEGLGYRVQPLVVPACAVDAQHRRDRVWIVAHAGSHSDSPGRQAGNGLPNRTEAKANHKERDESFDGTGTIGSVLAHAQSQQASREGQGRLQSESAQCGEAMADTNSNQRHGRCGTVQVGQQRGASETEANGDTAGTKWLPEPDVGRVAHGVSRRVDRLKGLGNAIVPQVAYQILKAIRAQIAP